MFSLQASFIDKKSHQRVQGRSVTNEYKIVQLMIVIINQIHNQVGYCGNDSNVTQDLPYYTQRQHRGVVARMVTPARFVFIINWRLYTSL
jgi:hypothetical protein